MPALQARAFAAALEEGHRIAQRLQSEYPDRFAGLTLPRGGSRHVVLRFTGYPGTILSRLTSNPLIAVERARFSLSRLNRKRQELANAINNDQESYVVTTDVDTNKVLVVAGRGGRVAADIRSRLGEDSEVVEVDDPVSSANGAGPRIDGQRIATISPPNQLWRDWASIGFAVTYPGANNQVPRGWLTAGHYGECRPTPATTIGPCNPNQNATGAVLTVVRQNMTANHDVELRTTTSSALCPTNLVRYGGGSFGFVDYRSTAVGTFSQGLPSANKARGPSIPAALSPTCRPKCPMRGEACPGLSCGSRRTLGREKWRLGDSGGRVFGSANQALGLTAIINDPSSPINGHLIATPLQRISAVNATVLTVP